MKRNEKLIMIMIIIMVWKNCEKLGNNNNDNNNSYINNDNIEMSPGDLKWLAITQTPVKKNLEGKTLK